MTASSKLIAGTLSLMLLATFGGVETAEAQARRALHTVSVQVPTIVRLVPDPVAVGPDGLPVYRVVTNDPALRRRLESGEEGGVLAERLAAELGRGGAVPADYRFTVVAP